MAAVTVVDAATVAVQRLGYAAMEPEQLQVVTGIVSGRECLGSFFHWLAISFQMGTTCFEARLFAANTVSPQARQVSARLRSVVAITEVL